MAIGMARKKRGLFGSMKPEDYSTPGIGEGAMDRMGAMSAGMPQEASEQRSGPNWGGIAQNLAGNIGDAISQHYGGSPVYAPMMRQQQAQQQQAAMMAERQRQQSLAAAQENQQWYERESWKRANPTPAGPDSFDRALSGAGIDPASPEGQALYKERAASLAGGRDEFVVVPIPGMGTYAGPRSGLSQAMGGGQGAPSQPVGRLTPVSPTIQNTPSPELGANGLPTQLSRAQYQATVNALGKAETDAWMQRNNIKVTN